MAYNKASHKVRYNMEHTCIHEYMHTYVYMHFCVYVNVWETTDLCQTHVRKECVYLEHLWQVTHPIRQHTGTEATHLKPLCCESDYEHHVDAHHDTHQENSIPRVDSRIKTKRTHRERTYQGLLLPCTAV